MRVRVFSNSAALARTAAHDAAQRIRAAISERGTARILVATGASQLEFLAELVRAPGIVWGEVEMFHLDEYVGLPLAHPASFRRYLVERLIEPTRMGRYHLLNGEINPERICRDEGAQLAAAPVDVAFAGIGENCHLAFNDPPADFVTEKPYLIVGLDEACRRQQVGEGWFATLADVPQQAISISVRQLLKAQAIIAVVPDARKAEAVRRAVEGTVSPLAPASILRTHPDATLYLDVPAASRLASPPAVEV